MSDDATKRALGRHLRKLRLSAGLSVADVVTAIGCCDRSYLNHAEAGDFRPSHEVLRKLAVLYGVASSDALLDGASRSDRRRKGAA